jgi:hypothetical protein
MDQKFTVTPLYVYVCPFPRVVMSKWPAVKASNTLLVLLVRLALTRGREVGSEASLKCNRVPFPNNTRFWQLSACWKHK